MNWGVLKSDLLDFISTIQEDTSKSINQVLGEANEEGEISQEDKLITDATRSFSTYKNVELKFNKFYYFLLNLKL